MRLRNVPSNTSEEGSKYLMFLLGWGVNFTKPGFSPGITGSFFNLTFASAGVVRKLAGRKTLRFYAYPRHVPNKTYRNIVRGFQAYGGLSFLASFQDNTIVSTGYVHPSQRCPYF